MKKYAWALVMLSLGVVACNRNDADPIVLKVTPKHHGVAIDSCTIFIRYNTVNEPADGKYDDSAKCVKENGIPVATFTNLSKGNHYVFGLGWDPNLTPPDTVKGSFAYPLKDDGTQYLDLAVSED